MDYIRPRLCAVPGAQVEPAGVAGLILTSAGLPRATLRSMALPLVSHSVVVDIR
jgi:hypothetical protein